MNADIFLTHLPGTSFNGWMDESISGALALRLI
jgi:hypothetical protein